MNSTDTGNDCDGINRCTTMNDPNFDSTIKRNEWEFEQISKSLKDCNCDDVINLLLADTRKLRRKNCDPKSESRSAISPKTATIESVLSSETSTIKSNDISSNTNLSTTTTTTTTTTASVMSDQTETDDTLDSNCEPLPSSSSTSSPPPIKRKPPLQPNRNSVVINLDRNRINLRKHRTKLLPRPISLPSSFKLLRHLRTTGSIDDSTQHSDHLLEKIIDLDFIKQLEDEIYRSRDEVQRETERKMYLLKKAHEANGSCDQCSKLVNSRTSYDPTEIRERKCFGDQLKRFNRYQHAVLLLDAWQLQPILMKRETVEFSDFYHQPIDKINATTMANGKANHINSSNYSKNIKNSDQKRSILIIDNSNFYPVFMSYEIGANGDSGKLDSAQQTPSQLPFCDDDERITNCEYIENHEQTRNFTKIFQMRVQQLATVLQNRNHSLEPIPNNKMPDLCSNGNAIKVTKPRMKCFRFMHRNRLKTKEKSEKLKLSKNVEMEPNHNNASETNASDNNIGQQLSSFKPNELNKFENNNRNDICDLNEWQLLMSIRTKYTMENSKLNWLLNTRPKVRAFQMRLNERKRRSSTGCLGCLVDQTKHRHLIRTKQQQQQSPNDNNQKPNGFNSFNSYNCSNGSNDPNDNNQMPIMVMPCDYDAKYCQLFSRIGWSCWDLMDIQNADALRQTYAKQMSELNNEHRNRQKCIRDFGNNNIPTIDTGLGNGMASKYVKQRLSSRLKRHSVNGSSSATAMTDVVKAWVYRRRCLYCICTSFYFLSLTHSLAVSQSLSLALFFHQIIQIYSLFHFRTRHSSTGSQTICIQMELMNSNSIKNAILTIFGLV